MSGCLACPVWNITYGKKKVSGNYTGTSVPLSNIKAGLDALVTKIKNSSTVVLIKARSGGTVSSSISTRLNLNHGAGPSGITIARKGATGAYSILGRQTLKAQ
jgi:phage tail sheath gpL-like